MTHLLSLIACTALLALAVGGCGDDSSSDPTGGAGGAGGAGGSGGVPPDELGRCADFDDLRQPFFGDTHVHTVLSLDANLQGTRPGPSDAYAFAQGESIGVQPYDEDGNALRTATPDRPIDFVMLSDHAEYLGTIGACNDPNSPAYDRPADSDARPDGLGCIEYRAELEGGDLNVFRRLNALTALAPEDTRYPALCGDPDGGDCIAAGIDVWG
ncbi:MAG: DUF3604 domain-containing protein, partial [Polyangiales bacterium]